jgi:hypothetical protein
VRRWPHLEVRVTFLLRNPWSSGAPNADRGLVEYIVCLTDLTGSSWFPCSLVWFQVLLFLSAVLIIAIVDILVR